MMLKCLIIEDEPSGRKILEEFISETDFLELIGQVSDPLQGLSFLNKNAVDLIFLDIQMPKMNGIDFLKSLNRPPMVIFTTAYPEYALQGYELDVLDYLLKPFSFERFLKACGKARDYNELYRQQPEPKPNNTYFFVKSNGKFEKIFFEELLFVEAANNYVMLYTQNRRLLTYLTLKAIEEELSPDKFMKVHKSYLVALDKIDNLNGEEIKIGRHNIPISRNLKESVLMRIVNNKLIRRE